MHLVQRLSQPGGHHVASPDGTPPHTVCANADGHSMHAGVLKEYSQTVPVGKLPLEYVTSETSMDPISR